jgi:hypothetical protein
VHSVSQRRARRGPSCDFPRSVSDLDNATLPPRSEARRRFASEVSDPLRYSVDAALRFPSALHVPASTSSFDFCRNFDRGHEPIESVVLANLIAARARGRAIVRREAKNGMPVAAGHRAPEMHGCPCTLQMPFSASPGSAPRLQRSTASGNASRARVTTAFRRPLAFARADGLEPRNPTRRRIEPLLEKPPSILRHRRRRHRGMEIRTTPVTPSAEARRRRGPREGPRL